MSNTAKEDRQKRHNELVEEWRALDIKLIEEDELWEDYMEWLAFETNNMDSVTFAQEWGERYRSTWQRILENESPSHELIEKVDYYIYVIKEFNLQRQGSEEIARYLERKGVSFKRTRLTRFDIGTKLRCR